MPRKIRAAERPATAINLNSSRSPRSWNVSNSPPARSPGALGAAPPPRNVSSRFKKGRQKHPAAGRKKGVRNKLTLTCREALATCFESLGGVEGLIAWAKKNNDNMKAFYTKMWIKLLPVQVKITEQNPDVVFSSYEALRDELRRTGVPIPERLAPPPVTIDAEDDGDAADDE
jgi:hypothetical protein